ncbi:MAG: carcinine hydrolase/isopenicillin-N N-acyltransferase family protein [Chlamydiota bacterium]
MECKKLQGCFLIGVTGKGFSETGEALIGSVSDDPYDIRTFLKAVSSEGNFSHLGTELISTSEHTLTERGYFARPGETTRGINEAGLAFTCAMVIENDALDTPNDCYPYANITTEMMNRCESVNQAIELFNSKGAIQPAYSVLLADANGDLAHLEVGSYGTVVYHHYTAENPGSVFAVNCYLSDLFTKYNAPNTLITDTDNNNQARRSRGEELSEEFKGEINIEVFMRILSDHRNAERDPMGNPILEAWGYSICNHGTRKSDDYPHEDLPWGTVSSEILQPKSKQFWYAYGWPCGEKPDYGDQILQENSWGEFRPFGFNKRNPINGVHQLTTPEGKLTKTGEEWRA